MSSTLPHIEVGNNSFSIARRKNPNKHQQRVLFMLFAVATATSANQAIASDTCNKTQALTALRTIFIGKDQTSERKSPNSRLEECRPSGGNIRASAYSADGQNGDGKIGLDDVGGGGSAPPKKP